MLVPMFSLLDFFEDVFLLRFAKQCSYSQFHIHHFLWFHCDIYEFVGRTGWLSNL